MPLQPLLESTCCTNCHRLLQRIVALETKLLAGLPKQAEHSADHRHRPPQHTAGESHEPSESQQFISVEEQAETDQHTNLWHKQGARPKGTRDIRLSRVSSIAVVASSTPDMAMTRLAKTGVLPPPIQLENRFEALMNVGEESPNVTEHGSCQPAANIATNRRSRSSRQQHSAQSAAEPRTLIVGDSIIRNISSRTTTACCFPQATVSDVNKELRNILMKHKTANQIIIHVGKNDIRKEQSELLKKDFSELIETLRRLEVQPFISGPLPARGPNMFSRLLGLNTWLQRTCSLKGVNFIDNFNLFWGHNKLGPRVLKDNIYFSLCHPSVECASPPNMNGTHTHGQSMSDHRTSNHLQSHHVVDTSHKDTDKTTQPQQALLMDTIPAEPCPQSSSQTDCDVLQQLQDSAPKDDFLVNSQESQDNIFQPPETPEPEPRSPDTLSLSPASPLLSFSQKMEELVYAGTRLSHSFAASPQISTKKRRAPQPAKPVGPARPPPPSRALRPLPQRQGPNPPPSAVGEPKTADNNCHNPVCLRTADPSNLRPIRYQTKTALETKRNGI
ncbi:hypothetical protein M9458_051074, partial [Cirrhinus mrigala]